MSKCSELAKCGVIAIAAVVCGSAFANRYSITDLGENYSPVGVNRVAVVAANNVALQFRGAVFKGGSWHKLESHTSANAINRAGNIAGVSSFSQALFFPHNSDPVVIQLPGGLPYGVASGLNNHDTVVGWYLSAGAPDECFRWTPTQGSVDFGAGENFSECYATAINDQGQITGDAVFPNGADHAYFYTADAFTDLGAFSNSDSSSGVAINSIGEVVGLDYDNIGSSAFLWDGKGLVRLDPTRIFSISVATSINDAGDIVGWGKKGSSANATAVRFAHGEIVHLGREVVNLGGWDLQKANAVNYKGVIVGSGMLNGVAHAFMLTPVAGGDE